MRGFQKDLERTQPTVTDTNVLRWVYSSGLQFHLTSPHSDPFTPNVPPLQRAHSSPCCELACIDWAHKQLQSPDRVLKPVICFHRVRGSIYTCSPLLSFSESIRKVLDKQPVKFVRAVKQDLRSGKSEDRVLVRRSAPPSARCRGAEGVFAVKRGGSMAAAPLALEVDGG